MKGACKHRNGIGYRWSLVGWTPATHIVDVNLKRCTWFDRVTCDDCGEWLSLGPSNDAPQEVAIEMRAVEMSDITASTANSTESIGWLWHEDPAWGEIDEPDWHAGYLARCIAKHATTEGA